MDKAARIKENTENLLLWRTNANKPATRKTSAAERSNHCMELNCVIVFYCLLKVKKTCVTI